MPYQVGDVLRSDHPRRAYNAYRVIGREAFRSDRYALEVLEVRPDGSGPRQVGERTSNNEANLTEYGYAVVRASDWQTESDPSPREEVKMKIHTLVHNTPEVATPVAAVTMPEGAFNGETICSRRFARTAWSTHDEPTYALSVDEPVLIEFSDGTLGVCAEDRLAAALAAYDLQLTTS